MLNEPLSINFAQQVDVGLFAPAPQLVTDGLTASQRACQLDVDGQWSRLGELARHRIGDHERVMQIGTPPQTVSLVKLEVELQGVSKHGTNRVIFQLCHGLTMLLVETDGFGSLQRTEHNPLGRLAPRLEHLVCSPRNNRGNSGSSRSASARFVNGPVTIPTNFPGYWRARSTHSCAPLRESG